MKIAIIADSSLHLLGAILVSRAGLNGTISTAQTTTVMPVVNTLSIGQRVNGNRITGHIRRLIYYPVRIPNSLLQAITI